MKQKQADRVAIGYVRVSTQGQAVEGVSLEAQRGRIAAWAAGNGLQLVDVYEDAGISGKRASNRPGLQAALAAACKRRGALVVYSLSRMARSTQDALAIAAQLDKAGADLVSLSEQLDTTSAAGKMVFRMLAVLAEFERDLVAERTTSAMAHLRRQGKRISRHVPFGFEDNGAGQLVAVDAEQTAIRTMRTLRAQGVSLRGIGAQLDAQGIAPKSAARWSAETVAGVLRRSEQVAA